MNSAGALGVVFAAALLVLVGCAGNVGLPYGAEPADPVGVWSESSADDSPYLSFSDDGTVAGYDGCNQLGGSWMPTSKGVEFSDLVGTQMFCEGVDDWVSKAASAEISGGTMTVLDEDGKELGELERTSTTPLEAK
jgi:heat shock protein HslJ